MGAFDTNFRNISGADQLVQRSELTAALGQAAGSDNKFNLAEFTSLASGFGLSEQQSRNAFATLSGGGDKVSVGTFVDRWFGFDEDGNGSLDKAEFRKGLETLGQGQGVDFGQDAGADGSMNKDEFAAVAKRAGITDQAMIDRVFGEVAGADKAINQDEFKAAFGDTKMSAATFKERFETFAKKNEPIEFGKAAGADGLMNRDEFGAIAERAGITDKEAIDRVFRQIAGADDEISEGEFGAEGGFGKTKLTPAEFKSRFEQLAADSKSFTFAQKAGADNCMNLDEFTETAKSAGITDQAAIDRVFRRIAGADQKISEGEFGAEDGFGRTTLTPMDFRQRFNQLAEMAMRLFSFSEFARNGAIRPSEWNNSIASLGINVPQPNLDRFFRNMAGADLAMSEAEASPIQGLSPEELAEKIRKAFA